MPFGAMFGALFFGAVAVLAALGTLGMHPSPRASLAVLGVALAAGLLVGHRWSRWAGAAAAALTGAWMLTATPATGAVPLVLLFGSVATASLLVLPWTGKPTTGKPTTDDTGRPPAPATLGYTGWMAIVAGLGVALGVWSGGGVAAPWRDSAAEAAPAEPAARRAERVSWTDFGHGLERARSEGKPLLVAFVTNWCGYCRKMDRTTWKHPTVVSRMDDVIAVRVDAEETRKRNGFAGRELAGRYGVEGYPTLLLLDPGGGILARTGGYQEPQQLLGWLERSFSSIGQGRNMQVSSP